MDQELENLYQKSQFELQYLPELIAQLILRGEDLPNLGFWLRWVCTSCKNQIWNSRVPDHCCLTPEQYASGIRQQLSFCLTSKHNILNSCLLSIFRARLELGEYTTLEELVQNVRTRMAPPFGLVDLEPILQVAMAVMEPTLAICSDLRLLPPIKTYGIQPVRFREVLRDANILSYFESGGRFHRPNDMHYLDYWVDRKHVGGLLDFVSPRIIVSASQIIDPEGTTGGGRRRRPDDLFHIQGTSCVISSLEKKDGPDPTSDIEFDYFNEVRLGITS